MLVSNHYFCNTPVFCMKSTNRTRRTEQNVIANFFPVRLKCCIPVLHLRTQLYSNGYCLQNSVVQSSELHFSLLFEELFCFLWTKCAEIPSLSPLLSGLLVSVGAMIVLGCCKSELNERERICPIHLRYVS